MAVNSNAANWVVAKRLVHWGIALAVTVALLAPKPEDGAGALHIGAGLTACALVLVRLFWRLLGNVRPYLKDAVRLAPPKLAIGARGFAPLLLQGARLGGFLFLAATPAAAAAALIGLGQGGGEESPLLEVHEALGTAIMWLAILHAVAVVIFSIIMKYDLIGVTLTGGWRAFAEGGARGVAGMVVGVALGVAVLTYALGPFDALSKAAALEQGEHGGGEHGDDD